MSKIYKEEMGTTINFMKLDSMARLYTSDIKWMRKMDKLCESKPETFKCIRRSNDGFDATYEFPKKLVTVRNGEIKLNLSEEEKERRRNLGKQKRNEKKENSWYKIEKFPVIYVIDLS